MSAKVIVSFLIKLVFIAGIFFALFNADRIPWLQGKIESVSFEEIREVLTHLDMRTAGFWLAFAAGIKLLGIFAGIIRWDLLLRGQGIRLPLWYLAKCWFMGRAIGLFLPGTVGLDGYRLVESSAYTGEVIKCTTVIAVEKLIGFMALAILVFLTLPLGMRLFEFNLVLLGGVLAVLFCFIATAFLLLLNPRVVQVLVQAVPVPGFLRSKINKLGVAITAYSDRRGLLLGAVVLGLCVHLGICLMYFGTAMAVTHGTVSVLDVLFVSPLVIVFSIIAPTVSGLGVREGGFGLLLGEAYGATEAFLTGHLGLWAGEFVPFILSVPLLLFATRPDKEKFMAELERVRAETNEAQEALELPHDVVVDYRRKLISAALAGLFGGLIGGAALGLAEAVWHIEHLQVVTDLTAYWWGPLVYGLTFAGLGLGIAAVLVFFYLLFNKFAPAILTFGISLAGVVFLVGTVFGRFRYQRDVLDEHALSLTENLGVAGGALGAGIGLALVLMLLASVVRGAKWPVGAVAGLLAFAAIVAGAYYFANSRDLQPDPVVFNPPRQSSAPPIIIIAVDTLRADYLDAYNLDAVPDTPNISEFAADSVVFQNLFAQSSWTKASFGTIFSGMYPQAHTATSKVAFLPDDVTTIAETLTAAGYYAQGYSNNPNITSSFNYGQGFTEYVDLKPDLYFGATPSCEKLVLYDILRKAVQVFYAKALKGRINITDFYQPAESITDTALDWLDGDARPGDAPFMLFLHYMDPHDPYRDPERPGKGYARVQLGNPDPEKYLEPFKRSYVYEIQYMDEHVGRLLDGIKERGLYDDSIIVFTSDHGEEFFEHGGWWHGLSLYDEQIGVPLMIKLPGNQLAGSYQPNLARHVDLAPTLAMLAGAEASTDWQGQSLFIAADGGLALLDQTADPGYIHAHLDFEGIELQALRSHGHKLIRANEGNKRDYAPVEFYNLEVDPGEQHNLAADPGFDSLDLATHKEALDVMETHILEGAKEPQYRDPETMTEEERQRLEALGYLGQTEDD